MRWWDEFHKMQNTSPKTQIPGPVFLKLHQYTDTLIIYYHSISIRIFNVKVK